MIIQPGIAKANLGLSREDVTMEDHVSEVSFVVLFLSPQQSWFNEAVQLVPMAAVKLMITLDSWAAQHWWFSRTVCLKHSSDLAGLAVLMFSRSPYCFKSFNFFSSNFLSSSLANKNSSIIYSSSVLLKLMAGCHVSCFSAS